LYVVQYHETLDSESHPGLQAAANLLEWTSPRRARPLTEALEGSGHHTVPFDALIIYFVHSGVPDIHIFHLLGFGLVRAGIINFMMGSNTGIAGFQCPAT
jgi:hypothetical protein